MKQAVMSEGCGKKKGLNNANPYIVNNKNKRGVIMEKRGVLPNLKKCDFCGGNLIKKKDIIFNNGKSAPINVLECEKCGESFSTLEESERVRKEINPTFWEKIKSCFYHTESKEISVFGDRLL